MSYNQSSAEKSDGQLRKSGGRSSQGRGFSGGGGGRGGGGGGGGAGAPYQLSSSSWNHPSLGNRSSNKSRNGQGGQSRVNPAGVGSETSAAVGTPRNLQNGAYGQPPTQGPSTAPMPSGPKPGDTPVPRASRPLPKAPSSQSAAGTSDPAAPSTPVKGDGAKASALQFGSISPGIVNGLQIPARTSSAPPNLDEQKRDQVRHDSFKAVPTQPIPCDPKHQPQPPPRKDVGVNQSTIGVKREMHQQITSAPLAPPPKSAGLPQQIPGISMPMPFQQPPPIPMQFGGPAQQQIPISLPIGNAPQVPQQMFVHHNLQSHPLQPQAMIHQGQGLGFGPQISHQLGPQLGNIGIGIAAPQFPRQQQPATYGGPRKTTAVKITYPETHEELRLDYSSGQRPPNNATPQSQLVTSFNPQVYFPSLQPGSYNPSSIFYPTSTSTTGPQPPRFSYPVGQGGQPISFMNQSYLTPMPGNKSLPSLHSTSEPVKSEPPLVTAPLLPTQGSVRLTSVPIGPKVGGPSVTISIPLPKIEEPKLVKQPTDGEVSKEIFLQQPEAPVQSSVHPAAVTPAVSTEKPVLEASSIPSVDSGSVVAAVDGKKREPIRRSDSLKDHQKKSSKMDPRQSQQQQTNEYASVTAAKSSVNLSKDTEDHSSNDVNSRQLTEGIQNVHESSRVDLSSAITEAPSSNSDSIVSTEAAVDSKVIPSGSTSSEVTIKEEVSQDVTVSCSNSLFIANSIRSPIEDKGLLASSTSSEMDDNTSKYLDTAVCQTKNSSLEVKSRKMLSKKTENVTPEVPEVLTLDSSNAKVHPVSTITESTEDVKPAVSIRQEDSGTNNSERSISGSNQSSERQFVFVDVEKPLDVSDKQAPTSLELKNAASNDKDRPSSSHAKAVSIEAPITYETTNKPEILVMESRKDDPTPSVASVPKDKLPLESTKAKPTAGKRIKRREILSKADAAGTSDLYNAYKGPEEKQQLADTSESVDSSLAVDEKSVNADNPDKDMVTVEEDGESKAEIDDWEDAADASTPNLEGGKHPDHDEIEATGSKKYTRDFLLTFAEQCTYLPVNFEIGSDTADALMRVPLGNSYVVDHSPYPSPGRITTERSPGVSRGDRRGVGMMDDDRWTKASGPFPLRDIRADGGQNFRPGQDVNHGVLRNPRGQQPNQFGPILPGHMQSMVPQGVPMRNNSDADRWRNLNNSRGLMPPPQTPLQVMHKAEKKYEVGKVSDEEQAKQRQLKGILNKLTPQNFEKLFQQVKMVNIDNTGTLSGVISQIFDKALMEPTFCEMYADFCYHLSSELPDFTENDEKITFKRLLLNKCQEEFERGEIEQAEADRIEEEGEVKQSDEEREEKRIKARRLMLGNIRLIGELYKKKMLTERIMHACIQKLLGQSQNPDEEDLEALCKLMNTIGDQIDHTKAKGYMDAYFDGLLKLSTNQKLSSRVRFMLMDVIDLRKNRWQQRRKVEGPKKIEEVHRDAAQERHSQTSRLARGPSMNSASRRGPPGDYNPRGSSVLPSPSSQIGGIRGLPSQGRGYGMQDVRLEDRHPLENRTLSLPLTQRPIDNSSITLGPQGGLARGMSFRGQPLISSVPLAGTHMGFGDDHRMTSGPNGYNPTTDRISYSSREDATLRYMPDRSTEASFDQPILQDRNAHVGSQESRITDHSFERSSRTTVPAGRSHGPLSGSLSSASHVKPLSKDVLREKSMSAIREFYSAKDEGEVALCIKELNSPSFYPSMVSLWVTDSFERKDMERDLLARLLVNLCKSRDSVFSQAQLTQGFEEVLSTLGDAVNDAPRAAEFLGRIFVKVVLENVVPFRDVGKLILEGGEEPGRLLETGLASEVLGSILEIIQVEKGDSVLKEILSSLKLRLEDFKPPPPLKSRKLDAFL